MPHVAQVRTKPLIEYTLAVLPHVRMVGELSAPSGDGQMDQEDEEEEKDELLLELQRAQQAGDVCCSVLC